MADLNDFEEKKADVSLKEIEDTIQEFNDAYSEYEKVSKVQKEASKKKEQAKMKLIDLMNSIGKKSYKLEGLGTVSVTEKTSVSIPGPEGLKEFRDYYVKKYGEDAAVTFFKPNSQSLNSFYKKEMEEAAARGEALEVPGLEMPTSFYNLSFRRSEK